MELQELKVCIYDSGLGNRVGSIVGDKVYDLHLCCVQQLTSDKKSVDCYRLANNLVPTISAASSTEVATLYRRLDSRWSGFSKRTTRKVPQESPFSTRRRK